MGEDIVGTEPMSCPDCDGDGCFTQDVVWICETCAGRGYVDSKESEK